jgi:hypothetical protein
MAEEENNIDQFFKAKLSDRIAAPPEEIWEGIESAIPKSLFFRFRYEQMNVYYCGMIICCFLFSTASLIYTAKQYYETGRHNTITVVERDTIFNTNSTPISASINNAKKPRLRNYSSGETDKGVAVESKLERDRKTKDSIAASEIAIKLDSAKNAQKHVEPTPHVKPKEKKFKKIVYITDYDTVVNYDTLRTKRKRR